MKIFFIHLFFRRFSTSFFFENTTNELLSFKLMTINLWLEKIDNSKSEYKSFRKILQVLNLDFELFMKLNILKKQIRKRLSLLRFLRKIISMIYEKQFLMFTKNKKKFINWHDFIDMIFEIWYSKSCSRQSWKNECILKWLNIKTHQRNFDIRELENRLLKSCQKTYVTLRMIHCWFLKTL